MVRLNGLEGRKSPDDMKPRSSSASQSDNIDEQQGDFSRLVVCMYREGGLRCFDLLIALRRYFMGTHGSAFSIHNHVRQQEQSSSKQYTVRTITL